ASMMGLAIMTPIGGKLGDLIGRRNLVLVSGVICFSGGMGVVFSQNILMVILFRMLLGIGMGTFLSVPYILAREINEPKDVSKMMGILSSAFASGGLIGSLLSGYVAKLGFLRLALALPLTPLIIAVILIGFNLPNRKREGKVYIDVKGIVLLVISLSLIILSLNFAAKIGLTNPKILIGLTLGIIALFIFTHVEKKTQEPVVSVYLFKNKNYVLLLLVGFACYFYMNAMNIYAPSAVINAFKQPTSVAGTIQLPRTILTIVLPVFVGTWISKRKKNFWISMLLATILVAIPTFILSRSTMNTSVKFYIAMLSITGIAESFRAVSITPAAQSFLEIKDLGVGTSLVNFVNTLAGLIATVAFGIVYDINTKADPKNAELILKGVNATFLVAAIVSTAGFIFVLTIVGKLFREE
ncbi:MAG: MFS transporter, partial [Peptoniphilus sp.]|nr:MFS transporter [Peptoniphilus sp.]